MDAAGFVSDPTEMTDEFLPPNPILLHDSVLVPSPLDHLSANLVKEISAIKKVARCCPLTPAGKLRYHRNCEIIRMVQKGLTPRNLAILQVYEEEQWKEEFATVTEFAKVYADLSKPQLFKILDEARIHYVFATEGMLAIRPTGRCREELVKVEATHWIAAWQFALDACKDEDLSQGLVRDSLRDFCRDHGIRFGRRLPNTTSFQLPPPSGKVEAIEAPKGDWKTAFTPHMKILVRRLVSADVLEQIESSFATKSAENVILDSILSLQSSKLSPEDALPWNELLLLIRQHEPEIYQALILLAIECCRGVIDETVLARCKRNTEAKTRHRRGKGGAKTTTQ